MKKRRSILYLAIETEDAGVLKTIRDALPKGCHLRVRRGGYRRLPRDHEILEHRDNTRLPELTARQHDILGLLVEGLSNKEIGRKLSLSHFTVRNHISLVMRLLNASSRGEVVARVTATTFASTSGVRFAAE